MKKDGGTVTNWQIHNLSYTEEELLERFPINTPIAKIFTGTLLEDPTGRFEAGFHIRSSLIVKIDREKGIIETLNTIYNVVNEGNDLIGGDIGDAVLNIFY